MITSIMLDRYEELGLPKPDAIWLDDPHDGGIGQSTEETVPDQLPGIPPTAKLVCHEGASGVIAGPGAEQSACNSIFPKYTSIPDENKSLVLTSDDAHGSPALEALHGVCAGPGPNVAGPNYAVDALDWGFCYRSFDSLEACALQNVQCDYALGDTPQNRYIGTWSDGVPIIGLKIGSGPLSPEPVPDRQRAPVRLPQSPPRSSVSALPRAWSGKSGLTVSGSASGDNGVRFVRVAVVKRGKDGCKQLTRSGDLVDTRSCRDVTRWLWADGDRRWRIRLPRLDKGNYTLYSQAIDSFGQQQTSLPPASKASLSVR